MTGKAGNATTGDRVAVLEPETETTEKALTARSSPSGRWARPAAIALLLLHATIAWLGRPPGIATRQDDARYVLLARSLGDGNYRDLDMVREPPHYLYPPVYPAMLLGWSAVLGEGYDRTVALSVVSSVVALGATFLVLNKLFSPLIAIMSLVVLSVNPSLVQYGGSVATEAPFTMLLVGSIAALAFLKGRNGALGAGGLSIAATLTRVAGIPLIAATGAHWLLERRWKYAIIYAVAALAFVGSWFRWSASEPQQYVGASYVADLTSGGNWDSLSGRPLRRFVRKTRVYGTELLPEALAMPTVRGTLVDNVAGVALIATGLAVGLAVSFAKWRPAALTIVAYSAMLVVFPWLQKRFLVPLLPLLVPMLLLGFAWIGQKFRLRAAWLLVVVPALGLTVSGAARTAGAVRATIACDRGGRMPPAECIKLDQASWFEAARYIEAQTEADARFLTLKPEPLYLYTGRRSIDARGALRTADGEFLPNLRQQGVEYVLLGSVQLMEIRSLAPKLEANCRQLEVVAHFPARTWLFRVRPEGDEDATEAACEAVRAYRVANENRDFERDP